jgi:putative ABC transport system permease protein
VDFGYVANPPGYSHNPLIRVGQTLTATYGSTSRHFLVTGILNEAGNPNVDRVVIINTNTGDTFFHRLGQYDQMIVLARSGNDVRTVIQVMNRVYGRDSFGIVSPAAIIQAQKHTQAGGASFTLEVGFIAMLVSAIGVVTTLYTSVVVCERVSSQIIREFDIQYLKSIHVLLFEYTLTDNIGNIGQT